MVKSGYTLVEILIVLSIMSIFGVMAIYGIRNMNSSQSVTDAQRNFISDLRATQNKVLNGADGQNIKTVTIRSALNQYIIDGATMILPNGVTFIAPAVQTIVCFSNSNLTTLTCGTCIGSFVCPALTAGNDSVNISFTNGSTTKNVTIQGSMTSATSIPGTAIYRIYAN